MILGLFGPPRAGKNEVVRVLVEEFGFRNIAISEPIKEMAHRLVSREFTEEEKDTPTPHLMGHSPRDLYVHVGQLDEYWPTLWVEAAFERAHAQAPITADANIVIESVGKQLQWNAILTCPYARFMSCYLAEVRRPGAEWRDNRTPIKDRLGAWVVHNDGDLDTLRERVRTMCRTTKDTALHYPRDFERDLKWVRSQQS